MPMKNVIASRGEQIVEIPWKYVNKNDIQVYYFLVYFFAPLTPTTGLNPSV